MQLVAHNSIWLVWLILAALYRLEMHTLEVFHCFNSSLATRVKPPGESLEVAAASVVQSDGASRTYTQT